MSRLDQRTASSLAGPIRDTLTCNLNGRTVNKATNLNLTKGRIGLQSESGEIYFRRLELFPL